VTLEEALKLVTPAKLVMPGEMARSILDKHIHQRHLNLSELEVYNNTCAWCNENRIKPPKKKYCSEVCIESALVYCQPQSPKTKALLFIHWQQCACAMCGTSYEDEIIQIIKEKYEHVLYWKRRGYYNWTDLVTFHMIGDNTGHLWQVDHKVPIFKGGEGIGLRNLQILCVDCHKKKTVEER